MRTTSRVLTAFLAVVLAPTASLAVEKPNVILLLIDDLGTADLGSYGSTFYKTPNLDGLAARGARFTQAYAACPVCSPTRASLMTGKYPSRVAVTDYIGAPQPAGWARNTKLRPAPYSEHLPLEEVTLAEAFKAGGYATGFVGKWHLGGGSFGPEQQGFDSNKGGGAAGGSRHQPPYGLTNLPDGPAGEHLVDRLTDESIRFIEENKDRPFFLELAHYDVHTPLVGKDELIAKYRAKADALGLDDGARWRPEGPRADRRAQDHPVYGAMMEALDQNVGRLLDRVETLGLNGKTLIVFLSDNGGLSTSEGSPTSNAPLRAGKGWLYEGGIRIPLIVAGPGVAESVIEAPAVTTDLYPTLLEFAGLPPRPDQHLDGTSLMPLLAGAPMADRPLFWHYPHYGNQGGFPGGALRLGDWKLIANFEDGRDALFNLREDPIEARDRAADEPGKVAELRRRLLALQERTGARMPTPNADYRPDGPDGRAPGGGVGKAARKNAPG